jgi:hypothetical protein
MWLNIPQITINRWCKPFPVMGSLWHCFNHINLIVMWIMVLLVPCWDTCLTQPTAWWWWFWIWSLVDENCNDHRWAPYDSAHFKQTWTLKHIKAINYITYVTRYPICLHIPGRLRPRQGRAKAPCLAVDCWYNDSSKPRRRKDRGASEFWPRHRKNAMGFPWLHHWSTKQNIGFNMLENMFYMDSSTYHQECLL